MSLTSRKNKLVLLKFFSLFSVIRGYNILIIVLAQYLASIFILAPQLRVRTILFDENLLLIVLASALVIAGGYIINSFYDSEKDLINRPVKTKLDHLISQKKTLTFYFILNFLSVIVASYVSFRAVLFFSLYIFGIWFYSHKLKRLPFIGNLTSSTLAIVPFFAVFIYYKNFDAVIFVHATFLFLIISMREVVKDLENLKGDLALNYQTIPIVLGEKWAKLMITGLVALTVIPIYLLVTRFDIGYMNYYFYASLLLLIFFLGLLWFSKAHLHYLLLHNVLKLIIVAGVFSILLIDINVLLTRII